MSHYSVLVIGENIEEQLARFNENLEIPRYVEYTKEELIKKEKESIEQYKNGVYASYLEDPIKYAQDATNQNHLKYLREDFPKKLTMSDEEIYELAIRYYDSEDIGPDGEVYSNYNPDSKWDWYQIGGRFGGEIAIKDGVEIDEYDSFGYFLDEDELENNTTKDFRVDSAHKKYIDFTKMHRTEENYNDAIRYWELVVEGDEPKNEIENDIIKFSFYKPQYFIERYKNKETYAKCNSSFKTWAVLKDDVWYEKGSMGMFAMSDETHDEAVDWDLNFYDRFIKDLPEDTLLTIVDCHI